ncbi:MAG: DNA polymerase I [Phycisphaerae bacterium]|nr:DNA polymerase I [Phycisphaerae bacterium]
MIDGHSQIFRAYYAPFRNLNSPTGEPTKAIHVFFAMLFNLIRNQRPDYLVVALDDQNSTASRRKIFPEYKAHRPPLPEDLPSQIDRIVSLLHRSGIPTLIVDGFEADDILATLVRRWQSTDLDIMIVTRDKDLDQLAGPNVFLFDTDSNRKIDAALIEEEKGYRPEQAIEIQSLMGDNVDNVPGIAGVGLKTAVKLIRQYGTAEEVLAHAAELTPKLRSAVEAFQQQLPITRQLVTLHKDLPLPLALDNARFHGLNQEAMQPVLKSLGLNRLITQMEDLPRLTTSTAVVTPLPSPTASPRSSIYQLIDSSAALTELVVQLSRQKYVAIDTETTGLNPVTAQLVGISLSWQEGQGVYIPVRAAVGATLPVEEIRQALGPIFANPQIGKVGHNIKYDLIVLQQHGFEVQHLAFDSMLASFLLDPLRSSHGMDRLAQELFDYTPIPITDLIGKGRNQITMDQVDTRRVCDYAAEDADLTWRFYRTLQPQIVERGLQPLLYETEMPLIEVLAAIERRGVKLDVPFLQKLGLQLADRLLELEKSAQQEAGRAFNLDSPKQLAEILFDELHLPVQRKTKTGRSTDAETLEALAEQTDHPLPKLILQYRELAKLKSTYVDSLPTMVSRQTGRVHASYNMIGAITGRLSSNDPNLQNIPIRTEEGRQIRRAFIADGGERVLLVADYSQIELRMLAHFSQDARLLEAFSADQDIHRFVAAQVFGGALEQVTSEQRSRAKAVNFGIIYGQTPFGLSRSTGMSVTEAKRFIELYFQRYPDIRGFIDRCIWQATQDGFVTTILGRRRPIPELQSANAAQRALGERLAVNTVLQGSAADLIKQAMIQLHRRWVDHSLAAQMLIQVHDELVFEVPCDRIESDAAVIRQAMTQSLALCVPLKVDVGWGPNWLESKSSA